MTGRGGRGRPYGLEFREQAVRLHAESGRPIGEVAKQIGVSDQTLRNWIAQARIDAGVQPGLTSEERAELRELRKKVVCVQGVESLIRCGFSGVSRG